MPAIQLSSPKNIAVIACEDVTACAPDEAIVRTHRMGICGTDLSGYLGKMPFFSYPRIPGHELGLEVIALGDEVTHLKVGDKCSLEPYINDPESWASLKGNSNCCPSVQVLGVHADGGLRTSTWKVPARKLHCGNQLTYDQLALVETLAIGLHAVNRGAPQPGETVLVIGAGPIGLACLEFLKLMEVQVIVMDMVQSRLDFCQQHLGITGILASSDAAENVKILAELSAGNLANVVIDATGSVQSMSTCFQYAAFTGRVVYVGITTLELTFPHAPVFHRRELTLLASRNAHSSDFPKIIDLIADQKINTDLWITHRISFDEVAEKFPAFTDPSVGAIKVIIEI